MTDTAIRVEGLSKRYRIGSKQESYKTLREAITHLALNPVRKVRSLAKRNGHSRNAQHASDTVLWALKDVTFDVKRGEVLGIIGQNGAGKSTLLKILSRITEPTEGYADIHGCVGSLLEVGSGFHPELSGRENIYFNGSVLGMKKSDIEKRFDEIVAFAQVEKFIDTPVKRYSSGMYMRLAFAVAAHLEPEILVVDEVLAVGDAAFQKKCLGKMGEVARSGRTVLFVSHNIGAIKTLCSRCLLLDNGQVLIDDTPSSAIERYLSVDRVEKAQFLLTHKSDLPIQVTKMWWENDDGFSVAELEIGQDVFLELDYMIEKDLRDVTMAVLISRDETHLLYTYDTDGDEALTGLRKAGDYHTRVHLPTSMFKQGKYRVSVWIGCGRENLTNRTAQITLCIANNLLNLTHKSYRDDRPGFVFREVRWDTHRCASDSTSEKFDLDKTVSKLDVATR
jgi:lipopolysaccharide transport system ATP-binding protein